MSLAQASPFLLDYRRLIDASLALAEASATLAALLSQGKYCPANILDTARSEVIWRRNAVLASPAFANGR